MQEDIFWYLSLRQSAQVKGQLSTVTYSSTAPSAECQHTEAWPARTYWWIFIINMTVYCLDNNINLWSRTFNTFFFVLFSFKGQNFVLSRTPISPVCPFWILKYGLEQFCQNCFQILYKTKHLACLKLKLSGGVHTVL